MACVTPLRSKLDLALSCPCAPHQPLVLHWNILSPSVRSCVRKERSQSVQNELQSPISRRWQLHTHSRTMKDFLDKFFWYTVNGEHIQFMCTLLHLKSWGDGPQTLLRVEPSQRSSQLWTIKEMAILQARYPLCMRLKVGVSSNLRVSSRFDDLFSHVS